MKPLGLRVGLVGPLPPPSGGMANQTLQLARLLQEEGVDVDLIQVNKSYSPRWIRKVKGIRAVFRLLPYLINLVRSARRVDVFHVMANSGWSWHLFAAPAIWIASLSGKPVIVNYRGGEAESFFEQAFPWVRLSLNRVDTIVVPSGFLDAVFKKRGFATCIVPNIIDISRFSPRPDKLGGLDKNKPAILVARNLEPIYDNATALRAFRIVRDAIPGAALTIAGSGPEHDFLEKLATELGIDDSVTFTGRVENHDMARLYRDADVMINPSLVDNMPNSVLEALASGAVVVSTNVGGVPYLVEHDSTALLVPPKNPEAMAKAILDAINDPAKARRLKANGIESVQQYTWPRVRARLFTVYQNALAAKANTVAEYK